MVIIIGLNARPGFTDAFYHYNAAVRVAEGDGFVDDYLWTFIAAPESLPATSHRYWMPGTTLVSAAGMMVFGVNYRAAQIGLILSLWGAALVAFWLGGRLGGSSRYAWQAGIITLCGGFFMRMWGQTDTFAPYAFVGSLTLVMIGLGASSEKGQWRWWLLAGCFAAAGHLFRNDGLLLLLTGWSVLLWPFDLLRRRNLLKRVLWLGVFTGGYLLVMLPWFARNLEVLGSPLPVGGTQSIWYSEYNDIFNYPAAASPEAFFANGFDLLLSTRYEGIFGSGGIIVNFFALEGYIVLGPFMLLALWLRRKDRFLHGVWVFALGLHMAFALFFVWPGIRGGLFHGVAALVPIWAVLALLGIDDVLQWVKRKRKRWNLRRAQRFYSWLAVGLVVVLSLFLSLPERVTSDVDPIFATVRALLPDETRIMVNDVAEFYYHTGIGGVTIPNEPPQVILELAQRYGIEYVLLQPPAVTEPMMFDEPPEFLVPIDVGIEGVELYAIELD